MHPAPMPWIPRKMMSWIIEPEAPQRTEPMTKIVIPARKIFLRPYMSANRPQSGIVAISRSRNDVNTHA